jgi:biotin carboxyl carrier protein
VSLEARLLQEAGLLSPCNHCRHAYNGRVPGAIVISQPPPLAASLEESLLDTEPLLEEIARLARGDLPPREFYGGLLERAVRAVGAVGGAVWLRSQGKQFQLEYQVNLAATGALATAENQAYHAQLLGAVAEARQTRLTPPRAGMPGESQAANPTDYLLAATALVRDGEPFGLIELFLRPGGSAVVQQKYERVLDELAGMAVAYDVRRELEALRERAALWGHFDQFAQRAHGSLDVRRAAYAIVNEGRNVIGCDRLCIAVRRGRKCKLTAVSGLDRFDRRSQVIRLLQKLIDRLVRADEPLVYLGDERELPPQLAGPLEAYLDAANVRQLVILPLREPALHVDEPLRDSPAGLGETSPRAGQGRLIGVLVAERFDADPFPETLRERVAAVAGHGQAALANAMKYQDLPFLPLLRVAGWLLGPRRLSYGFVVLLAIAAAVGALVFLPADFRIEARGELQPRQRYDVFAPHDGIVTQVLVRHGQHVDAAPTPARRANEAPTPARRASEGERPPQDVAIEQRGLLAVLTNTELDYELSRVEGEIRTAEKRLRTAGIQILQVQNPRTAAEIQERDKLMAEAEELKKTVESLGKQVAILQRQKAEMSVYSPAAGQVVTWNIEQTLDRRPVRQGQRLMQIADLQGPWLLELHVPDRHVGHVLAAQQQSGTPLEVEFILATDPETTFAGRIERVAETTDNDEVHGPSVLVTVSLDERTKGQIAGLRPGATVIGRVACGERSLGYTWFHDLIDAVYTWVWF